MTNFNTEIKSVYQNLTKTEKKVADFILATPRKVLYLSITELAEECGVGDTSVYRFCRSIGLRGYQEFKVRLSLSLNEEVSSISSVIIADGDIKDTAMAISEKYKTTVTQTMNFLCEDDLISVVEQIEKAENVYFFGVGASGIIAQDAFTHFVRVTSKVRFFSDVHTQIMLSNILTEKDLVIIISHSGETEENISIAKNAKNCGACVCCMTRYADSTLSTLSDKSLIYRSFDTPTNGSAIDIRISQLYLVDLIYQIYFSRNTEKTQSAISKTNEAIIEQVY